MNEIIFLIAKSLLAISTVIILTIITERISPKWAGIISALPTGTAITLFFLGLEISPQFASQSAVYNMAGLVGLLVLIFCYYKISQKTSSIVLSILGGIGGYTITIFALRHVQFEAWQSALLLILSAFLFMYLLKGIKETKIKKSKRLSYPVLLFRGVVAAVTIIVITALAQAIGPEWTGLFSGFPSTVVPLIVITHYTYEKKHVHSIIKHIPSGLLAMVVYSLSVWHFYPSAGVYYGTLVAYGLVGLFLAAYVLIQKIRKA